MGTRSLTVCKSRWTEEDAFSTDATIYRHSDGYPSQQGDLLHCILNDLVLANGIGSGTPKNAVNGPGRLAKRIILAMGKAGALPSLEAPNSTMGQKWEYHIETTFSCDDSPADNLNAGIKVRVFSRPMTAFGLGGEDCTEEVFFGTNEEFSKWLQGAK